MTGAKIVPFNKRRPEEILPSLSGNEAKYLLDRAVSNAKTITPHKHEWIKKSPDGSVEEHKEVIRIDLRRKGVQNFANRVIKENKSVFDRLAEV